MNTILLLVLLGLFGFAASGFFILRFRLRVMEEALRKERLDNEQLLRRGAEFVANVSHELKTPLAAIKGYSETLRSAIKRDPDKALEFLQRIDDNAERLALLINDLLELSRIEAPNFHHQVELFKVDPVLQEVREQFAHKLSGRGQTLLVRNEVENLNADKRMFEHAITNLLENAHRYSGASSLIEITGTLKTENGRIWAEFKVQDNGPGISVEDLPHIFERFYRADKSRNRLSGGSGLGLAIVKHIMLSHGGHVKAQSEAKRGASFALYFPL